MTTKQNGRLRERLLTHIRNRAYQKEDVFDLPNDCQRSHHSLDDWHKAQKLMKRKIVAEKEAEQSSGKRAAQFRRLTLQLDERIDGLIEKYA